MQRIYIVALILLLTGLLWASQKKRERFQSTQMVLTTNKLNFEQISSQFEHIDKKMDVTFWNDIIESPKLQKALQSSRAVLNEVDVKKLPDEITREGAMPIAATGYFVALVPPTKKSKFSCAFDLTNKKIGYFDRCDYHLIQAILLSYRIPSDSVTLVELPYASLSNLSTWVRTSDIDMFITYVVPKSAYHNIVGSLEMFLMSWDTIDLDRLGLFYPNLRKVETNAAEFIQPSHRTVADKESPMASPTVSRARSLVLLESKHYIVSILPSQSQPPSTESFITRLQYSSDARDPTYGCYGDLLVESKAYCNSRYSPTGEPKPFQTVWDRRCQRDDECPFYSAKTGAPTRGGCKDGFCEFPIGVQRTSFMKYNAEGKYKPFCFGCSLKNAQSCCEKQDEPQYAFVADINEGKVIAGV